MGRILIFSIYSSVILTFFACEVNESKLKEVPLLSQNTNRNIGVKKTLDTLFYLNVSTKQIRLKIASKKYGAFFFGEPVDKNIPDNLKFNLKESQDSLFLIVRSCGSECQTYCLIDVISRLVLFEVDNIIYYDLKEKIILFSEGSLLKLVRIKSNEVVEVDSKQIDSEVQCPLILNCISNIYFDKNENRISFDLEIMKNSTSSLLRIEFEYPPLPTEE